MATAPSCPRRRPSPGTQNRRAPAAAASSSSLAILVIVLGLSALAAEVGAAGPESKPAPYVECRGRRVWVHELPSQFNADLLYQEERDKALPAEWYTGDMLKHLSKARVNLGFGKPMPSIMGLGALNGTWFNTDHNALENIFYARLLVHPCRVPDWRSADLVYVPYLGAHDSLRNMHKDFMLRDRLALELVPLLRSHPAWGRANGRDHFLVLGSPLWDFNRQQASGWGSQLMAMEGVRDNMWTIVTERGWEQPLVMSSPQPTGFHPQTRGQVALWQRHVAAQERKHLFAFAGGRRGKGSAEGDLREKLFWQCASARDGSCGLVDCSRPGANCLDINTFFGLYLSASFCLHPIGDSCTRRSLVDAALAGCIPVVFRDCTLRTQFSWHLGPHAKHPERIMVYIPSEAVRGENDPPVIIGEDAGASEGQFAPNSAMVEEVLRRIPESEVEAMRSNIIDLIPRLTYGGRVEGDIIHPPDFTDAVDVIVDGLATQMKGVRA